MAEAQQARGCGRASQDPDQVGLVGKTEFSL